MTSSISTQTISSLLRQSVLQMQSNLATSEAELTTGTYADLGLTLGARTGQSVSLQEENSLLQTIADTNQVVTGTLSTTQTALTNLQSSAQSLLNSFIEGNGSNSNASSIQALGQSNLQSLISTLNTSFGGSYIFSGVNTASQPVTDYFGPGAPNKAAVDAAFSSAFGMNQTSASVSSISGTSMQSFLATQFAGLFQGTQWSSNWSSASDQTLTSRISETQTASTSVSANNSAFQQLAQAYTMVADLGTQNLSWSAYQAVATTAQGLLSSAITNLVNLQASVGLVQSNISASTNQMSAQMNILSTQIGNLDNVDPYDAATRVSNLQTQIETAYSLTSQLHQLSLVQYL
ncbi:MAG: flagellar hook-associated family protein [Methylocapsa sp.]|nr:flagellar hook-associated family protein [Methylocapsa sp.]